MNFIGRNIIGISWSLLGFYVSAVLFAMAHDREKNIVEVFNSLGSFISAGGALAAILTVITMVQHRKDDRERNLVKYANYVLFVLDRQARYINMFGNSCLKPHEDRPLNVQAYLVPAATFDQSLTNLIDTEASMFLLAVNRPELISLLDETQRDYRTISVQIEKRNDLYLSKYQGVIQAENIKVGSDVCTDEINQLVGEYVVHELMSATEQMYEMLPMIQKELLAVQRDLYDILISEFPNHKFLLPLEEAS